MSTSGTGEVIEGATVATGRRRRWWWAAGLLVVALAAGAVVGVPAWQRHQDRVHQQQAYDTGHAALLAADCTAAQPALERAAAADAVPGLAAKATDEVRLCVRHLAAVAAGAPADRLVTLVGYLGDDPAPPASLAAAGRELASRVLLDSATADLTTPRGCTVLDQLDDVGVPLTGEAGRRVPQVMLACIRQAQKDEDPSTVLDLLERLRVGFPSAPEARDTAELTTRLWVQTGRYFHSQGTIEAWQPDRSVREGSARVRLEIYNDSRDLITLRLVGPQVTEVAFPACRACPSFRDGASARCVRKGAFRTVLLAPGIYELVTGQDRNQLKYGRMTLRAHDVYRRCFYSLS